MTPSLALLLILILALLVIWNRRASRKEHGEIMKRVETFREFLRKDGQ